MHDCFFKISVLLPTTLPNHRVFSLLLFTGNNLTHFDKVIALGIWIHKNKLSCLEKVCRCVLCSFRPLLLRGLLLSVSISSMRKYQKQTDKQESDALCKINRHNTMKSHPCAYLDSKSIQNNSSFLSDPPIRLISSHISESDLESADEF